MSRHIVPTSQWQDVTASGTVPLLAFGYVVDGPGADEYTISRTGPPTAYFSDDGTGDTTIEVSVPPGSTEKRVTFTAGDSVIVY